MAASGLNGGRQIPAAARPLAKSARTAAFFEVPRRANLDAVTEFFVLAWDAFGAPKAPYDEALHLARVVGINLDRDVIGRIAGKKTNEIQLWDSETRVASHGIGPIDGSRGWIDTVHHAAFRARRQSADAAAKALDEAGLLHEPGFLMALEAVLEVLPVSRTYAGFDPTEAAAPAASDFDALEKLRRLALEGEVDEPEQLSIFRDEAA